MEKLRLRFEKTGRAVYISHLDLMRTLQRAFLRAGLPLQYSEGFNPHALISILLPLSVGAGSLCELMDFRLRGDADLGSLPLKLNRALPEGLRALEAYPALRPGKELKWLHVQGRFEYDAADPGEMAAGLSRLFGRESLVITKKTKRGEGKTDLLESVRDLSFSPERGAVRVEALVSAQEPTVNPELLAAAAQQLAPALCPDFAAFTRLETFDKEMNVFR